MSEMIQKLKKLNAAYIAALEYDYCPDESHAKKINKMFKTGLTNSELEESLIDNQGRRPDEIAGEMSDLIKEL